MPQFGKKSLAQLGTCDDRLQKVFHEVIKYWDCAILEGHRSKEDQDTDVASGRSKTPWPTSKHNGMPSKAVDAAPYPIVWPDRIKASKTYEKDLSRWYLFAGFVKGVAAQMGITLRIGADWDGDGDLTDQTFNDLPHFEIVE